MPTGRSSTAARLRALARAARMLRAHVPNEHERREGFFEAAAGYTPYVAFTSADDGALFFVRTDDEGMGRGLFARRDRSDRVVLERAVSTLRAQGYEIRDRVIVDIGANIGTTTVAALRRHEFSRALACEPARTNYQTLCLNLAANGLDDRVVALPVAVSDEERDLPFDLRSENSGAYRACFPDERTNARPDATVRAVTLDALAARGLVDPLETGLLWVDAQGHEGHVLDGARRFLAVGVPLVTAFRPARLRRADGFERFARLLETYYTHVVDLRGPRDWHPAPLPATDVRELAASGRRKVTDLLALRLGPARDRSSPT